MTGPDILSLGIIGMLGMAIAARHSIKVIIECFQGSTESSVVRKLLNLDEAKLAALLLHSALLGGMTWGILRVALVAGKAAWGP